MRFWLDHMNLFLFILLCIIFPFATTQTIDAVWFPSTNFTYCYQGQFDVSSANRYFNALNSTYHFDFDATSNATVNSLNQNNSTWSASMFELRFGFQTIEAPAQQLCPDISSGCPVNQGQSFHIQRSFNLSNIPLYPLADITAQYSAIDADSNRLVCIRFAPVGYQHPTWQKIFTYLPIGITVSAAIVSLIASFTIFHAGEHDIFLLSSNYAMLPGVLRLKTPGFFDLVFYAQFIVMAGQFNIDYPRFHALFTSDFSWSFLLFESSWLNRIIHSKFQSSSSAVEAIATIPRYTIYKRQTLNNTTSTTTQGDHNIDIIGTGMLDFASASGIDINALFFTFLVYILIIVGSCAILCSLAWILLYAVGKISNNEKVAIMASKIWDFSIGLFFRILSLLYLPLMTLSFYQLMLPSFWYITLAAAILLVAPFLIYGLSCIKLLQIRPASFLFTELKLLLRYGSLYNKFTDDTFHFYIAVIVYKSIMAAMVGLFQTSGLAQLVIAILTEFILTAALFFKWPYADTQVNIFHLSFGCIRTIVLFLNICYLPQLQASVLAKQYVGYAQMAIHCLAFVVFLAVLIKNIVLITVGLSDDELDESGRPPAPMVMWRKRSKHKRPTTPLQLGSSSGNLMTVSSRSRSHSASFYMASQSNSQARHSNPLAMDAQTLEMLTNYYGVANTNSNNTSTMNVAVLKPDEVRPPQSNPTSTATASNDSALPCPPAITDYHSHSRAESSSSTVTAKPPAINRYVAQTYINAASDDEYVPVTSRQHYRIDDSVVPSSEPLMTSINMELHKHHSMSLDNSRPPPPPLPPHGGNLSKHANDSIISSIYSPPHQPSPTSIALKDEV